MTRERLVKEFEKHHKENADCYDLQLWLVEVEKEHKEQKMIYKDILVACGVIKRRF